MDSFTSSKSTSKVDMFLYNYHLKNRGLSHSSLHRSNSDFYRTSTEDCHVVLDRNLAESRRPPEIEDELTLIMYNSVLLTIVDTWEGKSSVKFLKKKEPPISYCAMSAISASQASSQDSIINPSKASSSSSKKSGSKKRDSKLKKEEKRSSKSKNHTSSEILKIEKELKSHNLASASSPITVNAIPKIASFPSYESPMLSHISSLGPLPDWKPVFPDEDCTITFKNGAAYMGRISRKGMEGKGLYRWSNGTIYEGEFVNNFPHGFGTYTWPDMSYYEGTVYQGLRHGSGFFLGPPAEPDQDRIYISGTWHLGKLVGKGILKQGHQSYEGLLENGVRNGFGLRHYDEFNVYAGEFLNNIRHGRGTMVWDNNDVYTGNWENGLKEGYGEYIWNAYLYPDLCFFNQNLYYGNWKEDFRHGLGSLILKSGCLFDGNWDKNVKHGIGLVVCKNGLIIKSDQLYYKNRPMPIKDDIKDEISEDKSQTKDAINTKGKTQRKSPKKSKTPISPTTLTPATSTEATMPEIVDVPRVKIRKQQKSLSNRLRMLKDNKIEQAMIRAIEKQLNYNRALYSKNHLKPRSIPFHLPDHAIVLEYHLNRLIANVPDRIRFKEPKPINLEYNPTVSFHTAPFDDSSSDLFNLDVRECQHKSPEITAKLASSPGKTLTSTCARNTCEFTLRETEECNLRNMITLHIELLRKAYDVYATIGMREEFPMTKPVLIRLFLWQFFRDCGLHRKGINLVQLDRDLSINVSSCLLYDHNPFERLQFFQFLHCLLEVSWVLYGKHMEVYATKLGVLATAFDRFILEDVTPGIEKRTGNVLTSFRNSLPIHTMYNLYKTLGEPLTIRHLISTIQEQCERSEESFNNRRITFSASGQAKSGHHSVVQEMVVFCPGAPESVFEEKLSDFLNNDSYENDFDLIGLRVLKDLNTKDLLICCAEICPEIYCNECIVKINYEITFLEFYEILILCIDRIFYNMEYEKWKIQEDNRLVELAKLTTGSEKKAKEKKKKKGK